MNRRNTIVIVILAGLALSGLVLIQLYWIRNAVNLKESYFRKSVSEAMSTVVYKLERMEAAERYQRMIAPGRYIEEQLRELDTLPYIDDPEMESDTFQGSIRISIGDQTFVYKSHDRRGRIMRDVLDEMFNASLWEPLSKHVKPRVLDSLLFTELKNKGIDTRFEYGIYSPRIRSLVMEKTGLYSGELVSDGLSINLNPRSVMSDAEYLLLYFPRQKGFLLKQMSGLLLGSILFILIIALSFYYAASTIFRQKKLSEMKNDFINNMTHEFKTPISTVALACEALGDESISKSEGMLGEYVNIIRQENERLGGMAEKVLQTAVLEKGELTLKSEELKLHDIIEESVRNTRMQASRLGGSVSWNPEAPDDRVKGDPMHLTNVINNLLDNALKYSAGEPDIDVSTQADGPGIRCTVTDKGIGISRADQRRIFEKLYRVPRGNLHDVKGFGLGLSYVKAIVELHGGNVSVDSEPGKGSTFSIWLPHSA